MLVRAGLKCHPLATGHNLPTEKFFAMLTRDRCAVEMRPSSHQRLRSVAVCLGNISASRPGPSSRRIPAGSTIAGNTAASCRLGAG